MTAEQARAVELGKEVIKKEFMSRYELWFKERTELDDNEYSRKYGWQKSERLMSLKDNLTAVAFFQKYIFSGATQQRWEQLGVNRIAVWALAAEGWFSRQEGNHRRPTWYYLSQQRAKEIWKEARA